MTTFKDSLNRDWSIELTVLELKHVRSELKVDLLDEKQVAELADDPVKLVDVISCLLTDQLRAKSVDERSFALGLADGGLARAVDAMVESLSVFFGARGRMIATAYRKQQATLEAIGAHAEMKINSMDLATPLKEKMDKEIETALAGLGS